MANQEIPKEFRIAAIREFTLEKAWRVLAASIFSGPVTKTQYDVMREMFFCAFHEFMNFSATAADLLPEDEAAKKLSELHKECSGFFEKLLQRKGESK